MCNHALSSLSRERGERSEAGFGTDEEAFLGETLCRSDTDIDMLASVPDDTKTKIHRTRTNPSAIGRPYLQVYAYMKSL